MQQARGVDENLPVHTFIALPNETTWRDPSRTEQEAIELRGFLSEKDLHS